MADKPVILMPEDIQRIMGKDSSIAVIPHGSLTRVQRTKNE